MKKKKVSKLTKKLGRMINTGLALLAILLIVGSAIATYIQYTKIFDEHTSRVASTVADGIDGDFIERLYKAQQGEDFDELRKMPEGEKKQDKVKEWLDQKGLLKEYDETIEFMEDFNANMGTEFVYICVIDNGKSIDLMEAFDRYNSLGHTEELESSFDYLKGNQDVEPTNTLSGYGWLSSGGGAIYNSNGEAVAIAFVDMDNTKIYNQFRIFLIIVSATAFVTVILVTFMVMKSVYKGVAEPIELLTQEAENFADSETYSKDMIQELDIKTDDEIENLYKSTQYMQHSLIDYMDNLKKVTAEKERIGAELNVATQIQADMLPRIFPAFPERKEFDLYASMDPAKEVGGDFYDFFMIDDDHIGLVMADVSGKGVPAALFMVIAKTLIKNRALMGGSPSEVLAYANDQLCEGNDAELFVTVWMAIIEISTGKGVAANAGHEHPVLRRKGGQYELVTYRHSMAVATLEGLKFKQHEFQIYPGDSLFVYTDGVPESTNSNNELYGTDRLLEALNKDPNASPVEILKNVTDSINEFVAGAEQFDDTTMMSFSYFGANLSKKLGEHKRELTIEADLDNMDRVTKFIENGLAAHGGNNIKIAMDIAVEEIFVNIANYAYGDKKGMATITVEFFKDPNAIKVVFEDSGTPYNPLQKPDPDVTLSSEERQIGGLGVYMVKKSMDEMTYEYEDGKNILTIVKKF
ncbi:MAG: SpoIIE family protein phosphatase [Eubacterium sp.]|nr:SpoIIE family protein phosphatase [Eubacterium sp.]